MSFLSRTQYPHQVVVYMVTAAGAAVIEAFLLVDVAREAGVPVPVAAEVAQALVAAVGAGLGDRDFTDIVELIERQAGVRLTLPPPPEAAR